MYVCASIHPSTSSLKYFFDNQPVNGTTTEPNNSRLPSGADDESRVNVDVDVSIDGDDGSVEVGHQHQHQSSPQYWRSDVGQKAIRTLPIVAPPLDFRQLNWNDESNEEQQQQEEEVVEEDRFFLPDVDDDEDGVVSNGRLVSTAHPAVGSALSAARRNASKRAATAPE